MMKHNTFALQIYDIIINNNTNGYLLDNLHDIQFDCELNWFAKYDFDDHENGNQLIRLVKNMSDVIIG